MWNKSFLFKHFKYKIIRNEFNGHKVDIQMLLVFIIYHLKKFKGFWIVWASCYKLMEGALDILSTVGSTEGLTSKLVHEFIGSSSSEGIRSQKRSGN